jgi:hypothetical protein
MRVSNRCRMAITSCLNGADCLQLFTRKAAQSCIAVLLLGSFMVASASLAHAEISSTDATRKPRPLADPVVKTERVRLEDRLRELKRNGQRLTDKRTSLKKQLESVKMESNSIDDIRRPLNGSIRSWRCPNGESLQTCRCGASVGAVAYFQNENGRVIDRINRNIQ